MHASCSPPLLERREPRELTGGGGGTVFLHLLLKPTLHASFELLSSKSGQMHIRLASTGFAQHRASRGVSVLS
jgi:hypothetical protein